MRMRSDRTTVRRAITASLGGLALASTALPAEQHEGPALYERLGGLPAIALVVDDFVREFVRDEQILANPAVRERKTPESAPYIVYQVTTLVCEVTGGPCSYTGRPLDEAHEGLDVTVAEWERMGAMFAATLERHAVPEPEAGELLEILGSTREQIVVAAD